MVYAFISSRLDYCNDLFAKSSVGLLQLVQNTVARVLTGALKFEHITPVLK